MEKDERLKIQGEMIKTLKEQLDEAINIINQLEEENNTLKMNKTDLEKELLQQYKDMENMIEEYKKFTEELIEVREVMNNMKEDYSKKINKEEKVLKKLLLKAGLDSFSW